MLKIQGTDPDELFEKLYSDYYPQGSFEPIKQAADLGDVVILKVIFENVLIGYLVARTDTLFDGRKELAILRALAIVKGRNPLHHVASHGLARFATSLGMDSVRIHSERRGMDALIEEAGYEFQESVFVKELNHGK